MSARVAALVALVLQVLHVSHSVAGTCVTCAKQTETELATQRGHGLHSHPGSTPWNLRAVHCSGSKPRQFCGIKTVLLYFMTDSAWGCAKVCNDHGRRPPFETSCRRLFELKVAVPPLCSSPSCVRAPVRAPAPRTPAPAHTGRSHHPLPAESTRAPPQPLCIRPASFAPRAASEEPSSEWRSAASTRVATDAPAPTAQLSYRPAPACLPPRPKRPPRPPPRLPR